MSPEHREYAEVLLQKARDELSAARALTATRSYADHIVGFLMQQAVEKGMKAAIVTREIEVPRTHDLRELLRILEAAEIQVPSALGDADWLTPWGVTFRYDDIGASLDIDKGLEAVTAAIAVAEKELDGDPPD